MENAIEKQRSLTRHPLFWPAVTGALWGLNEGLWFFLVPDVLLTFWAIRSTKKSAVAIVAALAGALLGGIIVYSIVALSPGAYSGFHALWDHLPGFRPKMVTVAADQLTQDGPQGFLAQSLSGIPFRIWVLESWRLQLPLPSVLFWLALARLKRFVLFPFFTVVLREFGHRVITRFFPKVTARIWDRGLVVVVTLFWIWVYYNYWGVFIPKSFS